MTVLAVAGIAVVGTLSVVAYRWWKNTMGADDDDIEVSLPAVYCLLFIGGVSCMRRLNLHGGIQITLLHSEMLRYLSFTRVLGRGHLVSEALPHDKRARTFVSMHTRHSSGDEVDPAGLHVAQSRDRVGSWPVSILLASTRLRNGFCT